ncbi:MAG: aminotransferase class I/II-fold pyridoxal phosphate-dependent enzyme [Thermoflexaceae bacterium]|nr:aminotransferase class I/II-fold pyridoxal phosphate-dependent enzyme [Thermoflexaceae bacterium]
MNTLYDKLEEYGKSDYIPFHMPGHKRNPEKFGLESATEIDITEIDGFDDYHYPQGIIRDIEEQAAKIYGTNYSFYLLNGSTSGLLTAISASVQYGDRIIVARNCHKAVYNAVYLNGLFPEYVYPSVDEESGILGQVLPDEIEAALEKSKAKAVVITSPTYEGLVSDVEKIASVCHEHGAVLIVDEAHGAHFNYHDSFPKTAMRCGADMTIESLHKTLPSYTQTAILHVSGKRVDIGKVKRYLSIYQTSSPSYVFMAGINRCIDYMASTEGKNENEKYLAALKNFRNSLQKLKNIKLLPQKEEYNNLYYDYDISKIVLYCRGRGVFLYEKLRTQYHIQLEMAAADYVIAMTSIGDDYGWYEIFLNALIQIDREMKAAEIKAGRKQEICAKVCLTPREALEKETVVMPLEESAGKISAEWAYAYPPGIPIIYPGEKITELLLEQMKEMKNDGVSVKGLQDEKGETILCIK